MHLLYCIFRSGEVQGQHTLTGVGGHPVLPVEKNGLSAAISEINEADLVPDIPRVMEYKTVIESFHINRTVIPMRYGSTLRNKDHAIHILKTNASRYEEILNELDGCVEMGIRLMIDDCRLSIPDSNINNPPAYRPRHPASGISGKAYLNDRRYYYAEQESIANTKNEVATKFRAALTGLFVKLKVEGPSPNNRQSSMFSLCFLVPEKSIDTFRSTVRHMRHSLESTKLLLTGPWPPYSFVVPYDEHRQPEFQD